MQRTQTEDPMEARIAEPSRTKGKGAGTSPCVKQASLPPPIPGYALPSVPSRRSRTARSRNSQDLPRCHLPSPVDPSSWRTCIRASTLSWSFSLYLRTHRPPSPRFSRSRSLSLSYRSHTLAVCLRLKEPSEMAGDHGKIHIINNPAAWDAKLEEAKSTGKVVVVDFTATWCGPCRLMTPIFVELSKKFENLIFLKVDVDEVQEVTAKWEVRAMPTFLFIKDGKQLDKIVGANKDELEKKCKHYSSSLVGSTA